MLFHHPRRWLIRSGDRSALRDRVRLLFAQRQTALPSGRTTPVLAWCWVTLPSKYPKPSRRRAGRTKVRLAAVLVRRLRTVHSTGLHFADAAQDWEHPSPTAALSRQTRLIRYTWLPTGRQRWLAPREEGLLGLPFFIFTDGEVVLRKRHADTWQSAEVNEYSTE